MKKIYSLILLLVFHLCSYAQWQKVNIPHDNFSFISEMKTPTATAIWGLQSISLTSTSPTNRFMRSADGGTTWVKKSISSADPNYALSNISPLDADTCYVAMYDAAVGTGGGIFKTTDGGSTWTQLGAGQIFDASSFPNWVYFSDAQHGVAMGDGRGPGTKFEMYTTSDYGNTWNAVPEENIPAIDLFPYGLVGRVASYGNRIWFYAYEGDGAGALAGNQYFFRSDDGGHTWEKFQIVNPVSGPLTNFTFVDELNGVYIGQQDDGLGTPYMLRTNDGGETWENVSYTGPLMNAFVSPVPGTNALVTTSGFLTIPTAGSSYSFDMGNTWTIIDEGATLQHTAVSFYNSDIGWTGQYRTVAQAGGAYKWTGTVLPVTLTNFTVAKTAKSALLNWQTSSESGFSYFGIERSTDGVNYTEIGRVAAAGNSSKVQQYSFEDMSYVKGKKNYYRLKLVNKDGKYNYSVVHDADFSTMVVIRLYPNPVKDVLTVDGLSTNVNSVITVVDNTGRVMKQVTTSAGSYTMNISQFAAGNYYLRITEGDKLITTLSFMKN